jgi:hypothetical protein
LVTGILSFGVPRLEAASFEVSYKSIESMVVARVMTDGGRHYIEGTPSDDCRYAFVQEPRVASHGGRLQITVLFAGRAGAMVAGKCVGPGDNFDLVVSGVPKYENGELFLSELMVEAPDTAYFKIVRPLVEKDLKESLRYPLREQLDYSAAWVSSSSVAGAVKLGKFRIDSIHPGRDTLRVDFDFGLSMGK